jgi:DNA-binding HxlR family transcriptional regulator
MSWSYICENKQFRLGRFMMTDDLRKSIREKIENKEFSCEKELTLSIISGKWKIMIIYYLGTEGTCRFSKFQKNFPKITHKVLSKQLKELEEDSIIHREVFLGVPPRVEYSITPLGQSLMPIILLMYEWGKNRLQTYMDPK